jgi:uncharacterized membrane protein
MSKARLEAFSDGVLAIVITIMVLELHAPHQASLASLRPLAPVFASYVLSFLYVAIYWNNHHHMLQASARVNGPVLWANVHLLFWLSLIPFATSWVGETVFARWPVVIYGAVLLLAGFAYAVLCRALIALHGADSPLARAIGSDAKAKTSLLLYSTGIALAFLEPRLAFAVYALVAALWLVPDKRIERALR